MFEKLSKVEKLKKTLVELGADNSPTYPAIAIAAAKGIFRPLFTMMDKKEDPKTKKYTALREGLTELIAIPTYWACGVLANKVANSIHKEPEKIHIAKSNFGFLAVGVATLLIVPALCSCLVKPFTNMLFKKDDKEKTKDNCKKLDIVEGENDVTNYGKNDMKVSITKNQPNLYVNTVNIRNNSGMRVG